MGTGKFNLYTTDKAVSREFNQINFNRTMADTSLNKTNVMIFHANNEGEYNEAMTSFNNSLYTKEEKLKAMQSALQKLRGINDDAVSVLSFSAEMRELLTQLFCSNSTEKELTDKIIELSQKLVEMTQNKKNFDEFSKIFKSATGVDFDIKKINELTSLESKYAKNTQLSNIIQNLESNLDKFNKIYRTTEKSVYNGGFTIPIKHQIPVAIRRQDAENKLKEIFTQLSDTDDKNVIEARFNFYTSKNFGFAELDIPKNMSSQEADEYIKKLGEEYFDYDKLSDEEKLQRLENAAQYLRKNDLTNIKKSLTVALNLKEKASAKDITRETEKQKKELKSLYEKTYGKSTSEEIESYLKRVEYTKTGVVIVGTIAATIVAAPIGAAVAGSAGASAGVGALAGMSIAAGAVTTGTELADTATDGDGLTGKDLENATIDGAKASFYTLVGAKFTGPMSDSFGRRILSGLTSRGADSAITKSVANTCRIGSELVADTAVAFGVETAVTGQYTATDAEMDMGMQLLFSIALMKTGYSAMVRAAKGNDTIDSLQGSFKKYLDFSPQEGKLNDKLYSNLKTVLHGSDTQAASFMPSEKLAAELFDYLKPEGEISQELTELVTQEKKKIQTFKKLVSDNKVDDNIRFETSKEYLEKLKQSFNETVEILKKCGLSEEELDIYREFIANAAPSIYNMGFADYILHPTQVAELSAVMAKNLDNATTQDILKAAIVGFLHDPKLDINISANLAAHPIIASVMAKDILSYPKMRNKLNSYCNENRTQLNNFSNGIIEALAINNDSAFVKDYIIKPNITKDEVIFGVIDTRFNSIKNEVKPINFPRAKQKILTQKSVDTGLREIDKNILKNICDKLSLKYPELKESTLDDILISKNTEMIKELADGLKAEPGAIKEVEIPSIKLFAHSENVTDSGKIPANTLLFSDQVLLSYQKLLPQNETIENFLNSFNANIANIPKNLQDKALIWKNMMLKTYLDTANKLTGQEIVCEDIDLEKTLSSQKTWGKYWNTQNPQDKKILIETLSQNYNKALHLYLRTNLSK